MCAREAARRRWGDGQQERPGKWDPAPSCPAGRLPPALQPVVGVTDGQAQPGPRGHPRRLLHPQVLAGHWATGECSECAGRGPRGWRGSAGSQGRPCSPCAEGPMRTVGQAVHRASPAAVSRSVTVVSDVPELCGTPPRGSPRGPCGASGPRFPVCSVAAGTARGQHAASPPAGTALSLVPRPAVREGSRLCLSPPEVPQGTWPAAWLCPVLPNRMPEVCGAQLIFEKKKKKANS